MEELNILYSDGHFTLSEVGSQNALSFEFLDDDGISNGFTLNKDNVNLDGLYQGIKALHDWVNDIFPEDDGVTGD